MPGSLLESAYGLAWRLAMPLLSRHRRLRQGLDQRTLASGPLPRARVWIQAASGGEAYLAWDILSCLAPPPGADGLSVLCTTNTAQGLGILERAAADPGLAPGLRVQARYFPFDAPWLMRRALAQAAPDAAVLLESEMWPGFLAACREQGVRVLVANGRMTARSLSRYKAFPGAARLLGPDLVLAMSPGDRDRFAELFGPERVGLMPNIKFDRLARGTTPLAGNPLAGLLPEAPFVVLGSVRRQEEGEALVLLREFLGRMPRAVVGLFPRHMSRLSAWERVLARAGLAWVRRSGLTTPARPGQVVLWDVFGELGQAYALARAAFVGGSLRPLGGQNFLEALGAGVLPVVGPHWSNFAWVGRELLDQGLLREVPGPAEAAAALAEIAAAPPERQAVREAVAAYAAGRTGGAQAVCGRIAQWLEKA